MTAGNSLFLQKPPPLLADSAAERSSLRRLDPLLSRTLDLTYPPLLVIQVPLYLFPCAGDTTGASRLSRSATSTGPGSTWACMGCSI